MQHQKRDMKKLFFKTANPLKCDTKKKAIQKYGTYHATQVEAKKWIDKNAFFLFLFFFNKTNTNFEWGGGGEVNELMLRRFAVLRGISFQKKSKKEREFRSVYFLVH